MDGRPSLEKLRIFNGGGGKRKGGWSRRALVLGWDPVCLLEGASGKHGVGGKLPVRKEFGISYITLGHWAQICDLPSLSLTYQ